MENIETNKNKINTVTVKTRRDVTPLFRREADDTCALPGYNAVSSGNFLTTFRDNLSAPSSRVKNPKRLEDWICDPYRWDR